MAVMAYFYFIAMVAALVGEILARPEIRLGADAAVAILDFILGMSLLGYHWKWRINFYNSFYDSVIEDIVNTTTEG